ncbi:DNA-directed DNA polymerase [Tanacetum coccineum]
MAETMEQYMSKTRTDYGSRVSRPKIEEKDSFELKGQFLKELRENTFSGSDNEDANEHIEKVLEIVDLFHILDSRGAVATKTAADAKKAIQEMAEYSQKWHNGRSRGRSSKTSDGLAAIQAQLNNLGREIKKVNEKVYVAQEGYEQCKGPDYTKDCPLKEEGKTLEEAYCTQFGGPFHGGGYIATAPGFYQRNNVNPSYQERRQSMEDTLSKFIGESIKRHEENSNLIKEIQASTDTAIRNQGASIKTLEIQIGQMSKEAYSKASHIDEFIPQKEKDLGSFTLACFINNVCFNNALVELGASVSVMPHLTYLNLGLGELAHAKLTVELADMTVKYPKGIAENVLVRIGKFTFPVEFIILDMPKDIKVPLIPGRPFLSTARAKIGVYKRKIALRVGEEKIIFKSVNPTSSLIKRVYMLSLKERMELDLEARLMGETLNASSRNVLVGIKSLLEVTAVKLVTASYYCSKKSLCTEFEKMMHKKFQMSSMGELTFFLGLQVKQKEDGIFISQDKYVIEILKKFGFTHVKIASTPMETQKPLLKDEDGEEVDVYLYKSMIGSLMYLLQDLILCL